MPVALAAGGSGGGDDNWRKAQVYFDRGNTVAGTGNYDYAIEMYISGLALDPDSIEAHKGLRDISLKRKAGGGKSIGFMESMKLKRSTNDDLQNLLNNEKLLAYDPGNSVYAIQILQLAQILNRVEIARWIEAIVRQMGGDSTYPRLSP